MASDAWVDQIADARHAVATALNAKKEPILLLDTSRSMLEDNSPEGPPSKWGIVRHAIGTIVAQLAAEDSEAVNEQETGGGGLRTFTFATGRDGKFVGRDLDDLNPGNLDATWATLEANGGTEIMPAVGMAMAAYQDEFGSRAAIDRPVPCVVVITDGVANDAGEFAQFCAEAPSTMYIEIALLGFGPEHDQLKASYEAAAGKNKRVKVTSFGNSTNAADIAQGLLALLA